MIELMSIQKHCLYSYWVVCAIFVFSFVFFLFFFFVFFFLSKCWLVIAILSFRFFRIYVGWFVLFRLFVFFFCFFFLFFFLFFFSYLFWLVCAISSFLHEKTKWHNQQSYVLPENKLEKSKAMAMLYRVDSLYLEFQGTL